MIIAMITIVTQATKTLPLKAVRFIEQASLPTVTPGTKIARHEPLTTKNYGEYRQNILKCKYHLTLKGSQQTIPIVHNLVI